MAPSKGRTRHGLETEEGPHTNAEEAEAVRREGRQKIQNSAKPERARFLDNNTNLEKEGFPQKELKLIFSSD